MTNSEYKINIVPRHLLTGSSSLWEMQRDVNHIVLSKDLNS